MKYSYIFQITSIHAPVSGIPKGCLFMVQFTLQFLAIALTSAAMATMLNSAHRVRPRFLFTVDISSCACSILSLILVFLLSCSKSSHHRYFVVFLHDLVMALLTTAGCAAATAIGEIGRDGIDRVGWLPICNHVGRFCNKATLSVAFSYSALTVVSVHKIKSMAIEINFQQAQEGI